MSAEDINHIIPDFEHETEADDPLGSVDPHVDATLQHSIAEIRDDPFTQHFPERPDKCIGCPALDRREQLFENLQRDQTAWGERTTQQLPEALQGAQLISESRGAPQLDIKAQDEAVARSALAEARAFPEFCQGTEVERTWWQALRGQIGYAACRSSLR